MKPEPLYYIQNKGFCGNCLIWWKDGGHGYTCNLDEAWMVPLKKAKEICKSRPNEDFPRPIDEVDKVSSRHVTQGALEAVMGLGAASSRKVKAAS